MIHEQMETDVVPTGIEGLDLVLKGGLPMGHLYLVEGDAGAGKSTLGLQFLLEGKRRGERTLWLSLSESESQLRGTAASHHWDIDGIEIFNPSHGDNEKLDGEYSFFFPAEIELTDINKTIFQAVERVNPSRVVFDPFSDMKLLARDPLRYRRQVLQLREFFMQRRCTTLLIQERTSESSNDPAAEGIVQGIIALYQHAPEYGPQRRRLRVLKLRGVDYRDGFHDVAIETGGMQVYPRLISSEHSLPYKKPGIASGGKMIDQMFGGGIERGSSLLILGPAGVGKSTMCSQFAIQAAKRNERVAVFLFDETEKAFFSRGISLELNIQELTDAKKIVVCQVNPAEFSPGEFTHKVQRMVENEDCRLVVIDSLNGYLNAMPDERHLSLHLHELLTYLSYKDVLTVLTINQHGFLGESIFAPVDVSYLADAAILLRYFETEGAVKRAISVMKYRSGRHESQIREMAIGSGGVAIGDVLHGFVGVLSGQYEYVASIDAKCAHSPNQKDD